MDTFIDEKIKECFHFVGSNNLKPENTEKDMPVVMEKKDRSHGLNSSWMNSLGELNRILNKTLAKMDKDRLIQRIWEHDYTVWKNNPADISNRLGWLHSPKEMVEAIPELQTFANEIRSEGFSKVILCGMGGSSLAPEVFRKSFGVKAGYLDLHVLDSTAPGVILNLEKTIELERTLFIISTKSGGTVETNSFMKYFYKKTLEVVGPEAVGNHFLAITDPGSSLENTAKALNFRRIFLNDSNIGGRYSALSYFGLVPASLLGIDLKLFLQRAEKMILMTKGISAEDKNASLPQSLGILLGEMTSKGQDKITLILSPSIKSFGVWIEQLLAESTGKEGKGILPIEGETVLSPKYYGKDRFFVYLRLDNEPDFDASVQALIDAGFPVCQLNLNDVYDLGGEFFRWEIATAIASSILKINPFDQPNVESAKQIAREMVKGYVDQGKMPELIPSLSSGDIKVFADFKPETLIEALTKFLSKAEEDVEIGGKYIGIQAYVTPSEKMDLALQELRITIQKRYRIPVTIGYGPRFLHSTGQLHKGDGGHGLFIQITADPGQDVPIPDEAKSNSSSISFGVLINAQALGDRQALLDNKRHVIRFHFEKNVLHHLEEMMKALCEG